MSSSSPRPGHAAHFAINADDTDRARRFYERVFGWRFNAWGPPGFWMIAGADGADPGIKGSLQGRREMGWAPLHSVELTIAIDDASRTAEAIVAQGGTILMPPTVIPTVGTLLWFRDTEGNVMGAMHYDTAARAE